jgi:hypothetical protein
MGDRCGSGCCLLPSHVGGTTNGPFVLRWHTTSGQACDMGSDSSYKDGGEATHWGSKPLPVMLPVVACFKPACWRGVVCGGRMRTLLVVEA